MPKAAPHTLTRRTGRTTAAAWAEPPPCRRAMMLAGRKVAGTVFITARVIMSSVATPGCLPDFSIFSMARRARGVAALPIPNRLAATHAPTSGRYPPRSAPGKRRHRSGRRRRAKRSLTPAAAKRFITPPNSAVTPHSDSVSSTARPAPFSAACDSAGRSPPIAPYTQERTTSTANTTPSISVPLSKKPRVEWKKISEKY